MSRISKETEVPEGEPFNGDYIGRAPLAEMLFAKTKHREDGFVVSVNAPWGSGKTWFLKNFQKFVESQEGEHVCIYFDAWCHDYFQDPLEPIFLEILEALESKSTKFEKLKAVTKELMETPITGCLLGKIIKNFIPDKVKEVGKIIPDVASSFDVLDEIQETEKLRKEYQARKASIKLLKSKLKKCTQALSPGRLYILVDELDRCQPLFALRLLERIKHLFDDTGVIFILSCDREQLASTVQCQYGATYDGKTYLDRFFDMQLRLTGVCSYGYINQLCGLHAIGTRYKELSINPEADLLHQWASLFKLSAREIHQLVQRFAISQEPRLISYMPYISNLTIGLICLQIKYPEIYKATKEISRLKYSRQPDWEKLLSPLSLTESETQLILYHDKFNIPMMISTIYGIQPIVDLKNRYSNSREDHLNRWICTVSLEIKLNADYDINNCDLERIMKSHFDAIDYGIGIMQ